ncbi:alpha/beta fold hydrolase [Massilia yuzhufengensis]|uniref:Sigma-B regulation protein RsbQ n=1 Tax=Massilia yuzhufengensis TaxID=1164594 RepID=A0A1I1W3X8_9BURK|nr:alpha/beta hydrolase [Massilia yuzhufengensis]SFD89078.1 sigma-B regulation protein RsbQ [Massilia yuzhufengensis]
MSVQARNNVRVSGTGGATLVFSHGFGCDQAMWRFMAPAFEERFRVITYDLVGSGRSDLSAYERERYATLHGYADDLLELLDECATGPVILVGHSVSSMIGMLATIKAPQRFLAQVMVAPSACYINDRDSFPGYQGGFERSDIDELLETMEANYLGWSSSLAPAIMGAPERLTLREELTDSFCRNDPDIAKHFARVTFLSDHRADVPLCTTPTLVLQCSDDLIAPLSAGGFLHQNLARAELHIIDNIGHCPHMSAPTASSQAIDAFLAATLD